MLKAATYLNDKNVIFIGTNTDERFPTSNKMIIPGKLNANNHYKILLLMEDQAVMICSI